MSGDFYVSYGPVDYWWLPNWSPYPTYPNYNLGPLKCSKCPVCEGRGVLPHGFYGRGQYSTSDSSETCRSCQGSGIVWHW